MPRLISTILAATMIIAPAAAQAGTRADFDRAAFNAAQAANKPVLVEVSAWWCPVCASQSRTIEGALNDPRNRDLVVFRLNYDKQKAEWHSFGVRKQGTLIAFKGRSEVGRLEFVTDRDAIRGLIARTAS
jgi:thioredoxin-like negative regulator of GroEL